MKMSQEEIEKVLKQEETKKTKSKEKAEANIKERYPHAVQYLSTLAKRQHGNGTQEQWSVTMPCLSCGKDMVVFTSDLHQKRYCTECRKLAKKEAHKKDKEIRELLKQKGPDFLKSLKKEEVPEEVKVSD